MRTGGLVLVIAFGIAACSDSEKEATKSGERSESCMKTCQQLAEASGAKSASVGSCVSRCEKTGEARLQPSNGKLSCGHGVPDTLDEVTIRVQSAPSASRRRTEKRDEPEALGLTRAEALSADEIMPTLTAQKEKLARCMHACDVRMVELEVSVGASRARTVRVNGNSARSCFGQAMRATKFPEWDAPKKVRFTVAR